ncbi:sigma-70 family RNA polymerase sigma factor [Allonocardiopsis opalescens]|uniref:RNA polymerase sigma factor (Sigma-70 family) n=1 Tax=Allonocardiopsis opalescens TaxID=1144618 RepID=A0A2T0Q308_9ACTN|nr:sigma-70 family RNA polymerase sigma factor [Allonocardiopsis opalescens]PRX98176.1 RNA polymerase sigma factor (sigma-70 family) [Allonocardiopsis opalescens]
MNDAQSGHAASLSSDAELIAEIRRGDPDPYGILYQRHVTAARGLARQLVRGESEVDDVVSEAFARVLGVIKRGAGPHDNFRAYLLTSLRRIAYDRFRGERRQIVTDDVERLDQDVPFVDPALDGLERSLIAQAFLSLPERWRTVLWHTEIEGGKPAEVAPVLGLSSNGVAALAYRAREGLRQAYLQMHLAGGTADSACQPALDRMGAYIRGGLAKRDTALVDRHLETCADCRAVYAELVDVNIGLRGVVGPLVLGPTAVGGYLVALQTGAAGAGGAFGWWQRLPKQQQAAAAGSAAVVVAAVSALALTGGEEPVPDEPAAAAPAQPEPQPAPGEPPAGAPQQAAPAPPSEAGEAPQAADPPAPEPDTPGEAAPPADTARFEVAIDTVGALVPGRSGLIALTVLNTGGDAVDDLFADIDLPDGVLLAPASRGGSSARFRNAATGDDWMCRTADAGAACAHGPLAGDTESTAYLRVDVTPDAQTGEPPRVSLRSGGIAAEAAGRNGVQPDGMPARYATDGHVRTTAVGNALLTCDADHPKHGAACAEARERRGERRDNDFWPMVPLDLDDDPGTATSSSARVELPGGEVRWAGLYFSGTGEPASARARVRGPGAGGYTEVAADEVAAARLPGYPAYQAFADVTELVRDGGAGEWWVADVPGGTGVGHYAGWTLVVVAEDADAPFSQAMVLDTARSVFRDPDGFALPVAGLILAAAPADISVVAWEGDADLAGDRVLLGDRALRASGSDPANAFDSSAAGAVGPPMTFGVDVAEFAAPLPDDPRIRLATEGDAIMAGVVTVTAPMRN